VLDSDAARLLRDYPRIFFACHQRHRRDPLDGDEISAHQASVLDHLDELEPTGMVELARHMGVTASTMSLTIDRLERGGYVLRERDARDGRRVNLRLTAKGVRMKEAQSVLELERVKAMLALLNGADRKAALRGLGLLAEAAQQLIRQQGHPRKGASS